jgi:hypothetical protein
MLSNLNQIKKVIIQTGILKRKINLSSNPKSIYKFRLKKMTNYDKNYVFDEEHKKRLLKKYGLSDISKLINTNNKDNLRDYNKFIEEREQRKLNFNRKNRWQQRELDEIFRNFDYRTSKEKDFIKISIDNEYIKDKNFNSFEEMMYFIEEHLKKTEFLSEKVISNCLDVLIKDFSRLKAEDINKKTFIDLTKQISYGITSFTNDMNILKACKFFDWFNIPGRNHWYNLETIITSKINSNITSDFLIGVLSHFANQHEGSGEFYDLFQYFFWSGKFNQSSLSELISLAYCFFITEQGYDLFYFDVSKIIMEKLNPDSETFDIIRIIQIYCSVSDYYHDLFHKIEELVLKRIKTLDLSETSMISCGFAISGLGTPELYALLEKIILDNFNLIDKEAFREISRGFIISLIGSDKLFLLVMGEFINKSIRVPTYTLTEYVYLMKCFHDRLRKDSHFKKLNLKIETMNKLFDYFEDRVNSLINKPEELLLEEIAVLAHYITSVKIINREIQVKLENIIESRIADIYKNPKFNNFLYEIYLESGMCSPSLINLLYETYNLKSK